MTLATRLSLFFLAALAAVLVGFSVSLYSLVHAHLHRQAEERLQAALDVLAAAAEVESGGIEWEPHERFLSPGAGETIAWAVCDDRGRRLDGSAGDFPAGQAILAADAPTAARRVDFQGQRWRLAQRRLRAGTSSPAPDARGGQAGQGAKKYPTLVLTAAVLLDPAEATLRRLALVLAGLSLGLWLAAAFVGRRLCRRALRPLTQMALGARSITAADLGQRLPGPATHDELEDLGRAFNDLLARLQEAFERQRRFTGDASHQLRTPLTALLGQIEVALRRDRDAEEYRRVIRAIQGQAARLRQIVDMLLFLARADAEARSPELERIDLAGWLAEHLRSWSSHPRAADLRLEAPAGGPLWACVQAPLLGQAVDNLLDNACKYSPAGSPITLRTWREGDAVCLGVEDRGPGIAAGDLPHLFEPFYRSAEARRQGVGGVGLGLAVAARIVAAFAGRIEVQSGPEKGTRFTLLLPAVVPTPG
jgi:heavy metal sensor kinase